VRVVRLKPYLRAKAQPIKGSRIGADLVEAFQEMAAYLRGEVEVESYEVPDDVLTPERVQAIRRKVAALDQGIRAPIPHLGTDHGGL
jgi:hypothetical protein